MRSHAFSAALRYALSFSLFCLPSVALARGAGPPVETVGCAELDADRIQDIVMIELNSADYPDWDISGLRVTLTCDEGTVSIEAWDPLTQKSLFRRITLNRSDAANRIAALAVFQLYKVSWMELLVSTPPALEHHQSVDGEPRSEDLEIARTVAEESIEEPPRRWVLSVGAGARLRSMGNTVPTAHTQLLFGRLFSGKLGLLGYGAFDFGEAHRNMSDVRCYGWALGTRLMGRLTFHRRVVLDFGVTLAAGYTVLKGIAKAPGLLQDTIGGATGEGALHLGPGLVFGDLVVILEIQGGYGIENPVGSVAGGDSVTMGKFLMGAALKLNLML